MGNNNRIHVNIKTGKSGPCTAKNKCPLGEDTPHFKNQAEANSYIESLEAERNSTFTTIDKNNKLKSDGGKRSKSDKRKLRSNARVVVAGKAMRELPEEIAPNTPIDDIIHLAEYNGEQVNINIQEADGSIHLSRGGDNEEEVLHMRTLGNDLAITTLRYKSEETLYDGSHEMATLHGDNGEIMEVRLKPSAGSGGIIMEVENFTPAPHRPKAQQQKIDSLRSEVEVLELRMGDVQNRIMNNLEKAEEMDEWYNSLSPLDQEMPENVDLMDDFYRDVVDASTSERELLRGQLDYSTGRLKSMLGR